MKVLMLVATSVATDTRVLREATTLVAAGHEVHVVGRSVPEDYRPPDGVTVSSVGTSSVFRREARAPLAQGAPVRLRPHVRLARWALLPEHRRSAFGRWAEGALADARTRDLDVVHAHDFTALEAGAALARERGVPLVYDTHELWSGRPREHRPTPLQNRRERRTEARLGGAASAVITVGDGVAEALRARYGWDHVHVVRNSFPLQDGHATADLPTAPTGLVYAGRLAAYRELETIAGATRSPGLPLPVLLMGPADETWLGQFDPAGATVEPAVPPGQVTDRLREAGLVLVTHSDRWENHRLAMPNKLFHAVLAGVPVVATDVGDLARVVRAHGIGTLYRPGDTASLARAVADAVAHYPGLSTAVRRAAPALSWGHDGQVLLDLYDRLAAGAPRVPTGASGTLPDPRPREG